MKIKSPIKLFLSTEHDCSYLADHQAQSLFIDPEQEMTQALYGQFIQQGFRRSGHHVYRPNCKDCQKCISVRLNVEQFILSRSQKRCKNKNKQVTVQPQASEYNETHYQMYANYVQSRHVGGGMDEPDSDNYLEFLRSKWCHTVFFEYKEEERLIAVAATDIVSNAFSAVYTFFDPDHELQKRSLGVNSIIWQAEEAQRRGLKWLYLGYWIKECQKMKYKDHYQPLEYYYKNTWHSQPPNSND